MIRAWRIDKAKRSKADAFSGEGGRRVAGRWNSKGNPVVYAASSLSLAALEKFVHLGEDGIGIEFVSYAIAIPAAIKVTIWRESDMPRDWRDCPAPPSTQALGDGWLSGRRGAVLLVPSVVTPSESNLLFNPAHPAFRKVKISDPRAFSFDPRMWRSARLGGGA